MGSGIGSISILIVSVCASSSASALNKRQTLMKERFLLKSGHDAQLEHFVKDLSNLKVMSTPSSKKPNITALTSGGRFRIGVVSLGAILMMLGERDRQPRSGSLRGHSFWQKAVGEKCIAILAACLL